MTYLNARALPRGHHRDMKQTEERRPGQKAEATEEARTEQMRRLVDEYANDLREIVRQLRQRLFN